MIRYLCIQKVLGKYFKSAIINQTYYTVHEHHMIYFMFISFSCILIPILFYFILEILELESM